MFKNSLHAGILLKSKINKSYLLYILFCKVTAHKSWLTFILIYVKLKYWECD